MIQKINGRHGDLEDKAGEGDLSRAFGDLNTIGNVCFTKQIVNI